jgi:protein TonB
MYYLDTADNGDMRFRNAVLLALAVHSALVLGVSFSGISTPEYAPQIEVTLATRPTANAPDEASLIAQANQEGSGDEADLNEVSTANNLPANAAAEQASRHNASEQTELKRDVLTTTALAHSAVSADEAERENRKNHQRGVNPELARLTEEIASLEASLEHDTRSFSDQPRVRRLTAASARQSADAAYLLDWRRRLEAVGNKYYPQASVRYGLYGDLRLLVVIRQDGSLEDIQVLSSSGYAVLDEAAIKIVRMAAPYSPFPAELRATTDKLEIVRTWHFQENPLSSQ